MNRTIQIRDNVRSFIMANDRWLTIFGKGLLAFVGLIIINHYFGYISFLTSPIIALIFAVGCAFIPLRAGGLLVLAYLFFQLTGLSTQVAVVALILMLASYGLSIFYGSKHMFNIDYIPVFLQIGMPYPIVVISALRGTIKDVTSVVCGGIISFYLKTIRENASLFIEEETNVSVIDVISKRMIVNPMFYIYITALIALFVIIVLVRNSKIKHSWIIAISIGIFTEMMLMMLGYIMTGNISKVPLLIVANVLAFAIGVVITYIFRDLDYDRVEKVQFEDDDYIYYVTAVPKIELAKEEKRITRITEASKGFHNAGKVEDDKKEDNSGSSD